jgi:spore germination protein KA
VRNLNSYLQYIKERLKDNFDVKYRNIETTKGMITLIFIDNLCDSKFISEYIITPLSKTNITILNMEDIKNKILNSNIVGDVKSREDALIHILSGDVVVTSDFIYEVLFCEAKSFVRRSVAIPETEAVVKGPREGFTEVFVDNIALIRRKIKNPDLKFENTTVGEKSNTAVVVCYIEGIAPKKLINYIKNAISNARYDFILDIKYIEELIDHEKTSFDTIGYSEKPDIVASKIMEGRVGVIVDGTPFVLTAPYFFIENFQTGDDYYINKYYANASRWFRWLAYFISTFLEALYIAISTYHFSLVPSVFVFRLAVSRAGVPFPTVVEVILMVTFFQIIKEAGLRLPQPIGQAMSIVGALILGDAAIGAGLTSQSTVLVVALSSICYFLIPKLYGGTVIWSFVLIIFGSALGLPGFYIGFFMLVTHLASLKTCGYPYLYPLGTLKKLNYGGITARKNLSDISNTLFDEDDDA